ncbi:unnamed protein product [Malus baccata var. baccata]
MVMVPPIFADLQYKALDFGLMDFNGTHEELPVDEENSAPLIGGSTSGRSA